MNELREFLEKAGNALETRAVPLPVKCVPPEELHLELTFKCNARCIMCNVRHFEAADKELKRAEIEQYIRKSILLKDMGTVVVSGGEAWLREDFVDIVSFLREVYPQGKLLILSNLSDTELALDKVAQLKSRIGLDNVSIGSSMDGVGAAHDRIRAKNGSFAALEKTLDSLRSSHPELYVSLNFTLMPENADQMLPAFRWCSERDYHLSFQTVVQKRETRQFQWTSEHYATVDGQLDAIIEEIARRNGITAATADGLAGNKGLLSQLFGLHYISKYLKEQKRYFPSCPCGERFAMIDPAGNVYFCPVQKDMIAGNIRESSFDAIWVSEKAEAIRKKFNERKCHCWLTCTNTHMLGSAVQDGEK